MSFIANFSFFPREILPLILSFLPPQHVSDFVAVSHDFYHAACHSLLFAFSYQPFLVPKLSSFREPSSSRDSILDLDERETFLWCFKQPQPLSSTERVQWIKDGKTLVSTLQVQVRSALESMKLKESLACDTLFNTFRQYENSFWMIYELERMFYNNMSLLDNDPQVDKTKVVKNQLWQVKFFEYWILYFTESILKEDEKVTQKLEDTTSNSQKQNKHHRFFQHSLLRSIISLLLYMHENGFISTKIYIPYVLSRFNQALVEASQKLEEQQFLIGSPKEFNIQHFVDITQQDLLDLPEHIIAEQLTVYDAEQFYAIESHEFCDVSWRRSENNNSPNVVRILKSFEQLSSFVSYRIVEPTVQEDRVEIFCKFLRISRILWNLRNYESLFALIGGLCSASVHRLHFRDLISEEDAQTLDEMRQLISLRMNFGTLRMVLESVSELPAVPYIGLCLSDFKYGWDTLASDEYRAQKKEMERQYGIHLVHWNVKKHECRELLSLDCWRRRHTLYRTPLQELNGQRLRKIPIVQDKIERCINQETPDTEAIWQLSLVRRPRR
eukprot:gb/GECH01002206.1/.p1 GENE.gb/GECH01002206.1/~~gb/GECH01002206.1/.p1  ORF type:complete len:555 (+),score=153.22 gb/GECH01002206.1/:1-1665(+)